jgi:hypothetical protein
MMGFKSVWLHVIREFRFEDMYIVLTQGIA